MRSWTTVSTWWSWRRRSGLRAAVGCATAGLSAACVTKVFPTRSHTVAAQAASRRPSQYGPDDWKWHMYDTSGLDWLGDQTPSNICAATRQGRLRTRTLGRAFSRTEDGRIYQRPFGGMTTDYGKGPRRSAPAPPPTAPATPCCTRSMVSAETRHRVLRRIFRARPHHGFRGRCRGVVCLKLDDGTIHRFRAG